ncbi:MobF family relaxase [Pseudomonas sp. MWU12-2037]|uniref:MobF family relaxase n=1 Tax=Pseudomonas sp. MWU12-2037 TaxID=2928690 RepID=UPI00200C35D8|nr:MobF family relaxase [Pseudomonas sp. MWU12-2037]
MAIFTVDKFAGGDIQSRADYFEKGEGEIVDDDHAPARTGQEDYYFKVDGDTLLAEFVGAGAAYLGLGVCPQPGDYTALMSGINPRSGASFVSNVRRGQLDKGAGVAGYSTSFNADKSISLLYASLPLDQQVLIERALMEAARRTLLDFEQQGYFSYRTGGGGTESHPGNVVVACYQHFTNRNQEPHLHIHAEIPNLILGKDGKWRTLDGGEIYKRQGEAAALFDCYLAEALKRDLPDVGQLLESDPELSGLRVAGITRETILQFSTRRIEILKGLAEMGETGANAARAAAKRTREGKKEFDGDELRAEWKSQLSDLHRQLKVGDVSPSTKLVAEALIFRNASVFCGHDLDRAAAQLAICHGGSATIPVIKTALVEQLGVIELPLEEGKPQLYTTEDYRQLEVDLLRFGLATQVPSERFALNESQIQQAIESFESVKGFCLRGEQNEAVIRAAGGERLTIIQGAAGTGKSASLSALREAYTRSGHRVIGLAPSGAAAAELENSSGIPSRTVHSLLMRLENDNPDYREQLSAGDVLILDEAGMADTRTLHKLSGFVERAGAKLVLVGDSKQLEAVGSASALSMLTEHVGSADLIQIARQHRADDREISQAWFGAAKNGHGSDAPDLMLSRGLIRSPGKDDPPAIRLMLREAASAHAAGTGWNDLLLLADRNSQVRELNNQVRALRKELGELVSSDEIRITVEQGKGDYGDLDLCPGDRVMLRRNQKLGSAQVFNGDRATIEGLQRVPAGVSHDGGLISEILISARLDRTGEVVTWKLSDYASLDHSYAMTVHKSQGLTVERAFYLASESTDRRMAYVAFTRSRHACPFYLVNDQDVHDSFYRRTAEFSTKSTALDADPITKRLILTADHRELEHQRAIETHQPVTKVLLEKAGDRFIYPAEEPRVAKDTPRMIVVPTTLADRQVAQSFGNEIINLIDKPADTRRKPGKPYMLPDGVERVALLAEPMEAIRLYTETPQQESSVSTSKSSKLRFAQQDRASQRYESGQIKSKLDLIEHAESLGYERFDRKGKGKSYTWLRGPGDDVIGIRRADSGDQLWVRTNGEGGDIFDLHRQVTSRSFREVKDDLRRKAFGEGHAALRADPESVARQQVQRTQREAEAVERAEDRRRAAYLQFKQASRAPNQFLAARGIDLQTLASTNWKTDKRGNAVFPHIGADGRYVGHERKNAGFGLYTETAERGIYVVNPHSTGPGTRSEIRLSEGGLDALSAYQMATAAERESILFVSSGGSPGKDTARALLGLAERHQVNRISMLYDNDKAGDEHSLRLAGLLNQDDAPSIQVQDIRAEIGLLREEDPNDTLVRRQQEDELRGQTAAEYSFEFGMELGR